MIIRRVQMAGAFYDKDGSLQYIGRETDEAAAWEIYLGWPHQDEIERAKAEGYWFSKVYVTPQ